jgi:hypothetical protein
MNLKRRLEDLEDRRRKVEEPHTMPPEVLVLTKMSERYQARTEGKEPPSYTQEEIEEMRRSDIETMEGRGVEASLRGSIGWQSPEAQQSLDEWEQEARRRVEKAKDFPPERWCEVWGVESHQHPPLLGY